MLWERREEPYRPVDLAWALPLTNCNILCAAPNPKNNYTLSTFPTALADGRFIDMLNTVTDKQRPQHL